jgi:hypothetical protein
MRGPRRRDPLDGLPRTMRMAAGAEYAGEDESARECVHARSYDAWLKINSDAELETVRWGRARAVCTWVKQVRTSRT